MKRNVSIVQVVFWVLFWASPSLLGAEPAFIAVRPEAAMRDMNDTSGKILAKLKFGQEIEVLDKSGPVVTVMKATGQWLKVRHENNTGFVFSALLRSREEKVEALIVHGAIMRVDVLEKFGGSPVLDENTGNTWTLCNYGQILLDGKCHGSIPNEMYRDEANDFCRNLKLNGLTWALPKAKELKEVSRGRFKKLFPFSPSGTYVSDTEEDGGAHTYFVSVDTKTGATYAAAGGSGMLKCVVPK